ncbi:hypothetical protein [Pseudomonas lopnurensis]|nr:hypothetical protein [Pseudomonas lopnurensis]MBE7376493.1 hypothetical protein [Pseudomonas lopnurensis]
MNESFVSDLALGVLTKRVVDQATQSWSAAEVSDAFATDLVLCELIQVAQHTNLLKNRQLVIRAMGISARTLQRWLRVPPASLTPENGIHLLRLLAVLARGAHVWFGDQSRAMA